MLKHIRFLSICTMLVFFICSPLCYSQLSKYYEKLEKKSPKKQFKVAGIKIIRLRESSESGSLSAVSIAKYKYEWYRIRVRYTSTPAWADGVEVRYHVLLRERSGKNYTMLVDSVVYDSVPAGSGHYSFVYLHPRTVQRYGNPEKVMCEIWYQGKLQERSFLPRTNKDVWWVNYQPLGGNLKTSLFTPFIADKDIREENINLESLFRQ